MTSAISDIKVKASDLFGNATLEEICVNDTQLLKNGFDLLADARGIYSNCFFCTEERITMSWCVYSSGNYSVFLSFYMICFFTMVFLLHFS